MQVVAKRKINHRKLMEDVRKTFPELKKRKIVFQESHKGTLVKIAGEVDRKRLNSLLRHHKYVDFYVREPEEVLGRIPQNPVKTLERKEVTMVDQNTTPPVKDEDKVTKEELDSSMKGMNSFLLKVLNINEKIDLKLDKINNTIESLWEEVFGEKQPKEAPKIPTQKGLKGDIVKHSTRLTTIETGQKTTTTSMTGINAKITKIVNHLKTIKITEYKE